MLDKISISAIIITKNVENLLPDCLNSLQWVNEIIILDSGSTDNTVKIAQSYGAKVFFSESFNNYGKQRQKAQSYANSEMILMIDADERVTNKLRKSIELILNKKKSKYIYSINRSNIFLGRKMKYSGWNPDRVIRLYPNYIKYNNDYVHESLNVNGMPVIKLSGNLEHLTCTSIVLFQKKQLHYANIWANFKHKQGKKCNLIMVFINTFIIFIKTLIIKTAFLDKQQGLVLSFINAQYTFNKYLILWSLNKKI